MFVRCGSGGVFWHEKMFHYWHFIGSFGIFVGDFWYVCGTFAGRLNWGDEVGEDEVARL